MAVERKEEQIIIRTEKGAQSISPMKAVTNGYDAEAFQTWQDECAKRLEPNARPAGELAGYLTGRYDLEELDPQDPNLQMFLCNLIPRRFGERLKHNPPQFSFDMTDEEMENWQRETDAQQEEIRSIPPGKLGIRARGFLVLHTDKNKPLIDADRRQWWEMWGKDHCKGTENLTDPEGCFCFEETTGEGSGSGFGGTALAREAALFLGVTEEDVKNRTDRFLMYSHVLAEKGRLPSLTDFKKNDWGKHSPENGKKSLR